MAEYIPKPWNIECLSGDMIEVQDDGGEVVCVLGDGEFRFDNALLISATPQLLAACRRFLEAHQAAMDSVGTFKTSTGKLCQCGPCVEARAAVKLATEGTAEST